MRIAANNDDDSSVTLDTYGSDSKTRLTLYSGASGSSVTLYGSDTQADNVLTLSANSSGTNLTQSGAAGEDVVRINASDGLWWNQQQYGLRTKSAATNVPNGATPLNLPVDGETPILKGATARDQGIQVNYEGLYLVSISTNYAVNTTGNRFIGARVNGTVVFNTIVEGVSGNSTAVGITQIIHLNAGDVVDVAGWQTSGDYLNATNTRLSVYKLN